MAEAAKKGVDAKAMLKNLAKEKTKIKFNDRMTIEIISDDQKHYRKGQIITPHPTFGKELIKNKIGKELKD